MRSSNWLQKQLMAIAIGNDSETDACWSEKKVSILKSTRMTEALKWLKKWTQTTRCCLSPVSATNRFGVYAAP